MQTKSVELHKRISARLYARQCWPVSLPVVKLSNVTISREGLVDGFIIADKGNTTASFHGFIKNQPQYPQLSALDANGDINY